MNAFSLFRSTQYIGAKELRVNLDKILNCKFPIRVMLHNKPTVAIIPDDKFLELLEIFEELKDSGLLKEAVKRFQADNRKKNPWFWSKQWQDGEQKADDDIKTGKVKTARSADELIRQLKK